MHHCADNKTTNETVQGPGLFDLYIRRDVDGLAVGCQFAGRRLGPRFLWQGCLPRPALTGVRFRTFFIPMTAIWPD
jgi:hypothetical protein